MALTFGLFDDSFMHKGHEIGSSSGYNERNWNVIGQPARWQTGVCGGEISYYSDMDQKNFLNPDGMYGHTWEEQASKYHISFIIANDAPRGKYGTASRFKEAGLATGYHFAVTSCQTSKKETRITVSNTGHAPIYRDAFFCIGNVRSELSLKGLLPGQELTISIPANLPCDKEGHASLLPEIACDAILSSQKIEYDCDTLH